MEVVVCMGDCVCGGGGSVTSGHAGVHCSTEAFHGIHMSYKELQSESELEPDLEFWCRSIKPVCHPPSFRPLPPISGYTPTAHVPGKVAAAVDPRLQA